MSSRWSDSRWSDSLWSDSLWSDSLWSDSLWFDSLWFDRRRRKLAEFAARYCGEVFWRLHLYAWAYSIYTTMHVARPDVSGPHSFGGTGDAALGL
jgi:hypothetical protein